MEVLTRRDRTTLKRNVNNFKFTVKYLLILFFLGSAVLRHFIHLFIYIMCVLVDSHLHFAIDATENYNISVIRLCFYRCIKLKFVFGNELNS